MATQTVDATEWGAVKNNMVKVYSNGALGTNNKFFMGYAVCSGGMATFNLTIDGTPSGAAIFTSVDTNHGVLITPKSASVNLMTEVYSISEDMKTLTVKVNQTTSVLLGVLQVVTATDGTPVSVLVYGT